MDTRKNRLMWTVLAILLPGPWTPVVLLAYLVTRLTEDGQRVERHPSPPPEPCGLLPGAPIRNPYAPPPG